MGTKNIKPPLLIPNETVTVCDVDWTLIEVCLPDDPNPNKQEMIDPRTGGKKYFIPYEEHIELLREMKCRNRYIIVWSAAGYAWANAIVQHLGLNDGTVDQVMTKPLVAVDDKPVQEWLIRCYLPKTKKN